MTPETLTTSVGELEGKRSLADLLDAVQGVPRHHKAAIISRVMKEVVAGRISSAEANEITKVLKT